MSWGTCYSGSNNVYKSAPPLMSDGRNFASWLPGNEIDKIIKKDAGIKNNSEYRLYLINNADKIVQLNQLEACNDCGCCPYFHSSVSTPNQPYLYEFCSQPNNDCRPIGYQNSDLKNLYLSREKLEQIKSNPITFKLQ